MKLSKINKYNIKKLLEIFKEYQEYHNKISFAKLEEFSGIPKHIWRYHQEELYKYWNEQINIYLSLKEFRAKLSNPKKYINRYYNDQQKLISEIKILDEVIIFLTNRSKLYSKSKKLNDNLKKEVQKLKTDIIKNEFILNAYDCRLKRYISRGDLNEK